MQAIPNNALKGSWFEKVSKRFLKEHDSADEYESIDLWSDWELRGKDGDRGIDIVITTASKEYIAVQCKFHQDSVSLNDLSTFLLKLQSGVGEVGFKNKKTKDKESLIENNPNDYKDGKYVFELLCRVIKLSEKSVDLIEKISEKRFE
ncbi:hypothetical protein ID0444_14560 [Helicobacter pylori]